MQLCIMIEGQNGLTWPRLQRIARAVEDLGFVGLYRSDHFTHAQPPNLDSLELWTSLTWLASHTQRIEFGPLVTPTSFRHPVWTARLGKDVDDLSGGRLVLGVGAGWQAREHDTFGFDLLDVAARMARFEESLAVITRLLRDDAPVTYEGQYYRLHDAVLLPRPQRPGGPRLLIGGNGERRTLPLVARYADEWNAVYLPPDRLRALNTRLDQLADAHGRPPGAIARSMMTGLYFGRTDAEVQRRLGGRSIDQLRAAGALVGTPDAIVAALGRIQAAGTPKVMLQWLDLDDLLDGIEDLAATVLRQVT